MGPGAQPGIKLSIIIYGIQKQIAVDHFQVLKIFSKLLVSDLTEEKDEKSGGKESCPSYDLEDDPFGQMLEDVEKQPKSFRKEIKQIKNTW